MSANIYWKAVEPTRGTRLSSWAPSAFIASVEKAFGSLPTVLTEADVPTLKGMAAMCVDAGGNPYEELIEAIETSGAVEIWAVH
jgi:hypothetical protein